MTINSGATLTASGGNVLFYSMTSLTIDGGTLNVTSANGQGGYTGTFNNATITGGGWFNMGNITLTGTNVWTMAQEASWNTGTLIVNSGTTTIPGFVNNRGNNIIKNGAGTLVVSGNSSIAGNFTMNNGTLAINAVQALGTSASIFTITGGTLDNTSGANLTLTANNTQNWNGDFTFNGTKDLNMGTGAVTMNASRTVTVNAGNFTVGGNITGSTFGLTKNGSGTMILTGANTYNGTTTINAGTLKANGGNAIADTGAVSVTSGAEFNIGANETVGSIAGGGNITLGSYTLTAGGANSNTTFSGIMSGTGSLTKNGTGALTLSGANTYTGATTINAGKLLVNGSAANSTITIASGGTLGGSGTVGATIVSGTIAPGNSPGTLTVGDITLNSGGVYTWEMADATGAAGTGWDKIAASGMLTVNSTSGSTFTIALTSSGAPTNWTGNSTLSWDILSYGSLSGVFDATKFTVNATAFSGFTANGSTWVLSDTGSALRLTYTANSGPPIWDGGTGNWGDAYNSGVTGFSSSLTGGNVSVFFTGAGGTTTNNRTLADVPSLAGITFNSTAGAYTLAANSGSGGNNTANALELLGNIVNNSNATQTINLALTSTATRVYDAAAGNLTIGGVISGTGGLTKNGSNLLTLSANNTYTGDTTINAGTLQITSTGLLGGGSYSGNIVNNGALLLGSNSNQILSGVISGTGALTKNGSGTLTLAGNNNYSGGTTLSTGTLVIGNAAAAGIGTITQSNGTSLLKIDTTGTITNAMSVYNVLASQSATLSGAITVNNATWDVDAGDTLTISGNISGTGGTTKNGTGTLVLSGNNSNTGATTVSSGTLTAASTKSLGATSGVVVNNGGSILVTASDAINDSANVTLNGGTLAVDGTFNESVGLLTLSANSVIDLDGYAGTLRFSGVGSWAAGAILSIWNWNGINQYGTPVGNGADTRHVVFTDATGLGSYLNRISFYSGSGSGFAGTAFEQGFSGPGGGTEIRVVPEPGTYITAAILLAFSVGFLCNQQRKKAEAKRRKLV